MATEGSDSPIKRDYQRKILSKSGAFSSPKNLKWPNHKVLTLQRVSQVLLALLSVLHIFEVL